MGTHADRYTEILDLRRIGINAKQIDYDAGVTLRLDHMKVPSIVSFI